METVHTYEVPYSYDHSRRGQENHFSLNFCLPSSQSTGAITPIITSVSRPLEYYRRRRILNVINTSIRVILASFDINPDPSYEVLPRTDHSQGGSLAASQRMTRGKDKVVSTAINSGPVDDPHKLHRLHNAGSGGVAGAGPWVASPQRFALDKPETVALASASPCRSP
ncbi:hypothetical protein N656DRAFT_437128 [Canariomyces notabilis]|uniref:Uncharacterized protein n=1 Tax=Canariomyces notabilis TaxID=2074819 RepID=A0AAN6QDR9_9PEZI|nr:hypothetical protein N656DRAFT_437128 [Canariomyces arenarius]